jgi:hypothetical protein
MFAWLRSDPEALVLWVQSVEDKSALVAAQPQTYFTTDHYDGHPVVLVRLSAIEVAEAAEMITDSWRLRAPKRLVASWREPGQSSD